MAHQDPEKNNETTFGMTPLWSPRRRPAYGDIRPGAPAPMVTMPGTVDGMTVAREKALRARAVKWARKVLNLDR
jgi:hypothetical protein